MQACTGKGGGGCLGKMGKFQMYDSEELSAKVATYTMRSTCFHLTRLGFRPIYSTSQLNCFLFDTAGVKPPSDIHIDTHLIWTQVGLVVFVYIFLVCFFVVRLFVEHVRHESCFLTCCQVFLFAVFVVGFLQGVRWSWI